MTTQNPLRQVHGYIDRVFPSHLERVQAFLRSPSISQNSLGISEAVDWLRESFDALGASTTLSGPGHAPIILARLDVGAAKTLLVYGMYDVQDVAGQSWSSPPFGAIVRDLPGIGPSIVARGACNSKGPLAGFLCAVDAFRHVDEIPVNLIFTIEGEEETGSPSLPAFYRDNAEALRADAAFEPFWACYGTDVSRPVLTLGTKGIVGVELTCRGGDWGGPTEIPVHSSVGAWLASPTWRLLKALNSFVDDQEQIVVEGMSESMGMQEQDEELLKRIGDSFDEKSALELLGAKRFKYPLHGPDLFRKYLFSPSVQVQSLAMDSEDTLPTEAHAKLTIRLPPNMKPDVAVGLIRRHLANRGFEDIDIEPKFDYPGSRVPLKADVVQAMLRSYRYHGCEPDIWPVLASATPYHLFGDVLGLPYVCGGLGNAGRSHSVDEYASVEGLKLLEKSLVTFLHEFGKV